MEIREYRTDAAQHRHDSDHLSGKFLTLEWEMLVEIFKVLVHPLLNVGVILDKV